jgi:hypothetical protein
MTCSTCPGAHRARDHEQDDDNAFLHPDISPALSSCTWSWQLVDDCIPVTHKPGVKVCGTYKGMCHLGGSSKGECRFPKTCEDSVLAVQGVAYEVAAAIRIGPSTQTTTTCPTAERTVDRNSTPSSSHQQPPWKAEGKGKERKADLGQR